MHPRSLIAVMSIVFCHYNILFRGWVHHLAFVLCIHLSRPLSTQRNAAPPLPLIVNVVAVLVNTADVATILKTKTFMLVNFLLISTHISFDHWSHPVVSICTRFAVLFPPPILSLFGYPFRFWSNRVLCISHNCFALSVPFNRMSNNRLTRSQSYARTSLSRNPFFTNGVSSSTGNLPSTVASTMSSNTKTFGSGTGLSHMGNGGGGGAGSGGHAAWVQFDPLLNHHSSSGPSAQRHAPPPTPPPKGTTLAAVAALAGHPIIPEWVMCLIDTSVRVLRFLQPSQSHGASPV